MVRDSWPRFFDKMMNENLSDRAVKRRIFKLLFFSFISLITITLLLAFHASRWYIFLTFFSTEQAVQNFLVYRSNFCPVMEIVGRRGTGPAFDTMVIQCPYLRKKSKLKALKLFALNCVLAALITTFEFMITFIIEAANG